MFGRDDTPICSGLATVGQARQRRSVNKSGELSRTLPKGILKAKIILGLAGWQKRNYR